MHSVKSKYYITVARTVPCMRPLLHCAEGGRSHFAFVATFLSDTQRPTNSAFCILLHSASFCFILLHFARCISLISSCTAATNVLYVEPSHAGHILVAACRKALVRACGGTFDVGVGHHVRQLRGKGDHAVMLVRRADRDRAKAHGGKQIFDLAKQGNVIIGGGHDDHRRAREQVCPRVLDARVVRARPKSALRAISKPFLEKENPAIVNRSVKNGQ